MNWYYAENGQHKGPLTDWDFAALARSGAIKPDTLVWRDGLPDWQSLLQLRPDLAAEADAPSIGGMAVAPEHKDLLVQQLREGVLPANMAVQRTNPYGLVYAGFWIRVAAKIIDGLVLSPITIGIVVALLFGTGTMQEMMKNANNGGQPNPALVFAQVGMQLGISIGVCLVSALYNGIMVAKWGASLGKMAVGIRVVRADGQPLTMGRAMGRGFAELLNSGMGLCSCMLLLYLMVAFDEPEKRALHDHICDTRVVIK